MEIKSNFKGSDKTRENIRQQLQDRFGIDIASSYDPYTNVMTLRDWNKFGYRIMKGQKALKSTTVIEKKNKDGDVVSRCSRRISLFHINQCEKVGN